MKLALVILSCLTALTVSAADTKIVLIAGTPSHGPGEHEFNAGCLLLKKCLDGVKGVTTVVYTNGWPKEANALKGAQAVVIYSDGQGNHPLLQGDHLTEMGALIDGGVGLGCMHYAVEPLREKGEKELVDWIGGAYEVFKSVNPHWDADFKTLPKHPVTRGVKPFHISDEWYFNMRFRDGMEGVTPILTAIPPESTMSRPDGDHSGNPEVREMVKRGDPQHMMWVATRPDGGRGFGFTGGHPHTNWANDDVRKLVLNSILWIAKVEVPEDGVQSTVTPDDLKVNLDPKGKKKVPAKPVTPPKP